MKFRRTTMGRMRLRLSQDVMQRVRMQWRQNLFFCISAALPIFAAGQSATAVEGDAEPLHARIDALIAESYPGGEIPVATDAEFMRRVYLDLVGVIPTSAEARAFLSDSSEDKRARLIDQLLQDRRFPRHFSEVYDVMVNERRPDKQVPRNEWTAFLLESFENNKPLNQLAREILSADGVDESLRPAVKFYLDREADPNLITRDVGRIFLGIDLQCAQCHDHPHIDTYYQSDYYGLFAFVNRGILFTDQEKKVFFAEKAEGDVEFTSVFTGEQGTALPQLPGESALEDPTYADGEIYEVKPDKNVRPIPKYSRRQKLAEMATRGDYAPFNRNLANRLWAHMMGKGLVDPVDLHHADNQPSHPELLELLGDQLSQQQFDVRVFLSEVARSNAYQRAYDLPVIDTRDIVQAQDRFRVISERIDELEVAWQAAKEKTTESRNQWIAIGKERDEITGQRDSMFAARDEAQQQFREMEQRLADVQQQLVEAREKQGAFAKARQAIVDANDAARSEPVVAESLQLFTSRLADAETQVSVLQEDETTVSEETSRLEQTRQVAEESAQSIDTQWQTVERNHQAMREAYEQASREAQANQAEIARLNQVRRTLVAQIDLLRDVQMRSEAEAELIVPQAELAEVKSSTAELDAVAMQLQGSISSMRQTINSNQERLASATERQQQLTVQHEAFVQMIGATEEAISSTPDEPLLAQAFELAKQRLAVIPNDLGETKRIAQEAQSTLESCQSELANLESTLAENRTAIEPLTKRLGELESHVNQLAAQVNQANDAWTRSQDAFVENLEERFVVASLRPLTPEQMAWSVMTSTGVVANTRVAVAAELDKNEPVTDEQKLDAAFMSAREEKIDALLEAKLAGSIRVFVSLFANAGGQPQDVFFATVEQTLFFKNAGTLRGWIASGGDSARVRASQAATPEEAADEIFLSTLTRFPTAAEREAFANDLGQRESEKSAVIQEWMWGLLTSDEFRFNH